MPINDPALRELVFGLPSPAPQNPAAPVTTGTNRTTGDALRIGDRDMEILRQVVAPPPSPMVQLLTAVLLGGLIVYVFARVLK